MFQLKQKLCGLFGISCVDFIYAIFIALFIVIISCWNYNRRCTFFAVVVFHMMILDNYFISIYALSYETNECLGEVIVKWYFNHVGGIYTNKSVYSQTINIIFISTNSFVAAHSELSSHILCAMFCSDL